MVSFVLAHFGWEWNTVYESYTTKSLGGGSAHELDKEEKCE
jgi:hypothetical protein